ncbi:MAG: VWA domain-containing protein [Burkholderiales bacterium]
MNVLAQLSDITLIWPRMLWLLAAVPVLVLVYFRLLARRRRGDARLASLSRLSATGTARARLLRHVPPLLFLAGLCALIVAVARPQAIVSLPSMHGNVILAIDTSGSMRATDVKPNRLDAAQAAARAFVENRQRHTRIGIVSIAGNATVVQSPTDNREDLLKAIGRLQLQPGTALGSGIYLSLATLLPDAGIDVNSLVHGWSTGSRRWGIDGRPIVDRKPVPPGSNRSAAIVLLSDGETNHGPEPLEAAKLAAEHGVRVYTVGIGSPEGVTLGFGGWSMRVRLDDAALKRIADITHGEYYAATTAPELRTIYEQWSARVVVERKRATELTVLFVGLGALLLVTSALGSVLWFHRVL